jgi:hypothetical protein
LREGDAFLQLGLFRFRGDPNAFFSDVDIDSLEHMVTLGFITNEDILLSVGADQIPSSFAYDVNVGGIPDSEIVVAAFGRGVSRLPALPAWAGIALGGLLFVTGVFVFGKRHTETQKG